MIILRDWQKEIMSRLGDYLKLNRTLGLKKAISVSADFTNQKDDGGLLCIKFHGREDMVKLMQEFGKHGLTLGNDYLVENKMEGDIQIFQLDISDFSYYTDRWKKLESLLTNFEKQNLNESQPHRPGK